MRIIKTIPKNPDFLNKYGKLLHISLLLSLFCQLVSTTTETGVFYSSFSGKFSFLGAWGIIPTSIMTFGFVAGLEVGGRAILTYATDAVLYRRFKGLECFLSFLVIIFAVLLLATSLNVSVDGTPQVIESFSDSPTLLQDTTIKNELNAEKSEILAQFSADSAVISTTKNAEIVAIKNQYKGTITKYKKSIENYTWKEKREGVSYHSKKNYLLGKIGEFESLRAQKTGNIERSKGNQLKSLLEAKNAKLSAVKTTHQQEKDRIQQTNDKTVTDHQTQKESNKSSLQYLVYACLFLFSLCVIVERIIYKEAGITFEYHFSENFYNESVLSAWFGYVAEAWRIKAHGKIEKWRKNLKEATIYIPTIRRKKSPLKARRYDDTDEKERTKPTAYENRMPTKNRKCVYCSDDYIYNHAKQKYCSDACRKKHWEEKNGRALKLKKKKIA